MPKKKSREVLALQKEAEKLQRRAEARERKGGLISPPRRTRNSLQNSPASESRIDRRPQQRGKAKPKKLDLTSPTTTPPTTKRTKSNAATKIVAASENNVDRKRRLAKREPKQPKQLDFSSPSTTPKRASSTSATTPRRLLRSNTCTDSQLAVTSKLRSKEAQLLCQEMNKQKEREKRRDLPKKPMEYRPNDAKTQVSFNPNAFLYRQHTMNEAELSLLLNDLNYPWNDEPLEPQQWAKVEERFRDAQRAMSKGDKSSFAIQERQEEQNRIIAFWQHCVLQRKKTRQQQKMLEGEKEESSGGAMYISGMPGTGKTASLQCVVRYMQSWEHSQELHSKVIQVNGMQIQSTADICSAIFEKFGQKENKNLGLDKLLLNPSNDQHTVLIIDELDSLAKLKGFHELLYTLFEFTTHAGSSLILIGIANALSLKELLPNLAAHRYANNIEQLSFGPYSAGQLRSVIQRKAPNIFADAALDLCTNHVAGSRGDLRFAFDLCNEAIDIAMADIKKQWQSQNVSSNEDAEMNSVTSMNQQQKKIPMVSIEHMFEAINGSNYGNKRVQLIRTLPAQQQLLLVTCLQCQEEGKMPILQTDLHKPYRLVAEQMSVPKDISTFNYLCSALVSCGLLESTPNSHLDLLVSRTELEVALHGTPTARFLSCRQ